MACWVVPTVASEIWHVPVEQILAAVKAGQLVSKHENGFTFIDVAPGAQQVPPPARNPKPKPITYKVVRATGPADSYKLPRTAEVITPAELEGLTADEPRETTGAMGDWRRGRRNATDRRNPPEMRAA